MRSSAGFQESLTLSRRSLSWKEGTSIRRHRDISEQCGLLPDLESCCHRDIGLEGSSVKSNKTPKITDPAKLCEPTYVPVRKYGVLADGFDFEEHPLVKHRAAIWSLPHCSTQLTTYTTGSNVLLAGAHLGSSVKPALPARCGQEPAFLSRIRPSHTWYVYVDHVARRFLIARRLSGPRRRRLHLENQ